MAKYLFIYGNTKHKRLKTTYSRNQSNLEHWNINKKMDEKDGYNVKIQTRPGKRFTKQVTYYSATHKDGSFFNARLVEHQKYKKR